MAFPFKCARQNRLNIHGTPEPRPLLPGLGRPLVRPRRHLLLEPLEPRVLLSADNAIANVTAALDTGFEAIYDEFRDLLAEGDDFQDYVPGFLITTGTNEDPITSSPTFGEAMSIDTDVYAPGPAESPFGAGLGSGNSLLDRFAYIVDDSVGGGAAYYAGLIPDYGDELALDAMDINADGRASADEIFAVLFFGKLEAIGQFDILDIDTDSDIDADDFVLQWEALITQIFEPSFLANRVQIDVFSDDGSTPGSDLRFAFDVEMRLYASEQVDLGYMADELDIALDPVEPGTPVNPTKVALQRTIHFGDLIIGLNGATDGSVAANGDDFYFFVSGMSMYLNADSGGGPVSLDGMHVNVGFLGTTVQNVGGDGIFLDMGITGFSEDPSHPDALGFDSVPTSSSTGSLTASAMPENVTDNLDPADDYVLDNDVVFVLRIGQGANSPIREVTLADGATSTNTTITDLAADLESAIDAYFSNFGLITVDDVGGKLRLNLPDVDPTPMGFTHQEIGLSSIEAGLVSPLIQQHPAMFSTAAFSFLLRVGTNQLPKLVEVPSIDATLVDPDMTPNNGDEYYEITMADVIAAVQGALDTAFGGGVVTAEDPDTDDMLTLSSLGNELEITRALLLNTVNEITLEELANVSEVLKAEPVPTSEFTVDLTLKADEGLWDTVADSSYEPEGTISVDIDPFDQEPGGTLDSYDLEQVVVDTDPNTGDPIVKAKFELGFGGQMDPDMLDFNVIGVPEFLGLVNDIGNWLERVVATDLFGTFDLPFADASLSDFLAFKDMVIDTLLIDDKDNGREGDTDDVGKLLEWKDVPGNDDPVLLATFTNAQQLEERLVEILDPFIPGDSGDAADYIDGRYDTINDELKYSLSLQHLLVPETAPVDSGDADSTLQFPLDFELDLAPLASIVTDATIKIGAVGFFDFVMGIKLGDNVSPLDFDDTELLSLNDDDGVELNTNLALTTVAEIDPIVGRLSGNAQFNVTWYTNGGSNSALVTVFKSFTTANETFSDLVDDINTALTAAGVSVIEADYTYLAGTDDTDSGRVVLRATDPSVIAFGVQASSGNVAYTELGLQNEMAATVHLVAPNPLGPPVAGGQIDFTVHVQRDGGGALEDVAVHVLTTPSGGNDSWTDNNEVLNDLLNDVNEALEFAGLGDDIVASRSGTHLVLSAINGNIRGFTVTDDSNAASALGLDNGDAEDQLGALGANKAAIANALAGGVMLRGQDTPYNPFGRLSGNIDFDINGVNVAVSAADTASNASVTDLVFDINQSINGTALAGLIVAENDGFHIQFRALDPTIGQIVVDNYSSGSVAQELGIAEGLSSGGSATDVDLTLVANKFAPVSYGIVDNAMFDNAAFEVSYDYDDGMGPDTRTWTATLLAANTVTNRSLFDLAADMNQAMNAGFIAAYPMLTVADNPLIAVVQGNRIVIGIKTVEGGAELVGDAAPGVAEYVTDFSVSAAKDSSAAKYLKLVEYDEFDSSIESNDANHYDFMVVFSNGAVAPQMVDLNNGGITIVNHKLDGKLGDLKSLLDNANLTVGLRPDGSGLTLTDTSGGVFTSEPFFRVIALNGSPAALQLGILASDATQLDVGQYDASEDGKPDGVIIGARLAEIDPLDRLFFENPSLSADFVVSLLDADDTLDLSSNGASDDAYAEANFGFVGVRLSALSVDQTLFSATATVPFIQNRIDVATLFSSLTDIAELRTHVGLPTVVEQSAGAGEFSLKVELWPDNLPSSLIDIPTTATIDFDITDFGTLQDVLGPVPDINLNAPSVSVDWTDIEELANFETVEFDNILAGLNTIADFLAEFGNFGFLGQQIPLLDFSINDVLELSNRFSTAIETVSVNPAGGLQLLGQVLSQAFGLPEFANNAERDAYFTERGIPDPTDLISFVLDDLTNPGDQKLFRLDLRLPVSFSEGRKLDLDLGDVDFLGGALAVDLQGGAGLKVSGYLDAQLSFGIDLDNPGNVYLYDDDTGIAGAITAKATNLAFTAAIGPMSVFIRDGHVEADITFGMDDTGSDGTHRILIGDPTALVHTDPPAAEIFGPEFTAELSATLPVFFPTDSEFLGDIELDLTGGNALTLNSPTFSYPDFNDPSILTVPDFSNIDLSSLNPFEGASAAQLLDTLDFFLQGLQDILDGEVFGLKLPLIGDQLASGADFIEQLRRDTLPPLRQFIEQAPELGLEFMQALLYSLLGPGSGDDGTGSDVMIMTPLGPQDLSEFVGLPMGQEIPGVDLLVDYLTGAGGPVSVADVIATSDDENTDGTDDQFQWLFRLGQTYSPSVVIDFDLGFPALGLDMNTGLDVAVAWDLATGLGLSTADGAYVFVGDQRGAGADQELLVTVDVDIPNSSETDLDGRIAFLQLKVNESHDDPDNELENEARGTYFHAQFDVDLFRGGVPADDRIGFSELGAIDVNVNMEADAEVNFEIRVQFNDQIVPDTISAILPALEGRFVLDWETGPILSDAFNFADSLKLVGFRDIRLDMGSFFSDFLGPVVDKVAEITAPLQPIIDAVTAPIPVLSDLAGQPVTLIDIAALFGDVNPAMIYAIADVITLVNEIGAIEGDELFLPLGDLSLFQEGVPVPGFTGSSFANALTDPAFRLDGSDAAGFDLDAFIGGANELIGGFGDLLAAGEDAFGNPGGDPGVTALSGSLYSGTAPAAGDFSFPLFDNPSLALQMLFGGDIPLVEYDLPPFGMDFTMFLQFPIWGPLFARITGGLGLTIDLAFGYDTRGVREFALGDFKNPLDLIAGFYVNDTDQAYGQGSDVAELTLKGEIFAGAEINLGIASAGVEGGVILTALFDLYDPDHNGLVYVDELVGNFLYEWNYGDPVFAPLAIFDVGFNVAAQLRAFIEFLTFGKTFEITPPITIVEFQIPFEREPFLATERGDGAVLLNIGSNAGGRLNGDTRGDIAESISVKSLSDNEIAVWSTGPDGFNVGESAAQTYHIGTNDDGERVIIVDAGDGDDHIDLSGVTHDIKIIINAGAGNDTVIGGQYANEIHGGLGDDDLTGGDGPDLIFGEGGNDTIHGGDGRDWIFGDLGRVSEVEDADGNGIADDPTTRFRSFASDDDGDDVIYGGDENSPGDIIFGGGGLDTIFGGDGDDLIFGDGGYFDFDPMTGDVPMAGGYVDFSKVTARGFGAKDRIQGNEGNDAILGGFGDDYIDGGADSDLISGGLGFDSIYGGSGGDYLFGDYHDDVIFGYRDPYVPADFTADGGDLAQDGDDYVEGGQGNDYIRGQAGDDTLHGNRGFDIIFGGAGNDTIGAGVLMAPWIAPADRIADVEAGGDIIFGGAHNDTIDSGEGSDIVFGDDGLVAYLDFTDTTGLLASGQTGSRIRTDGTMSHKLIGDGDETVLIDGYESVDDDNPLTADLYVTESDANDGSDHIIGGDGRDIIFGGGSDGDPDNAPPDQRDTIFGDFDPAAPPTGPRPTGKDTIIGDGGRVELSGRLFVAAEAVSNVTYDGVDHISGNDYGDYIFGGGDEDLIWGFENPAVGSNSPLELEEGGVIADNDTILGDNGRIVFDATESANRIKWIYTTARYFLNILIDSGRSDEIYGQFEKDVILGGLNSSQDLLFGGLDDDIILGDQGELVFDGVGDGTLTFPMPADADVFDLDTLDLIRSFEDGLGGGDRVSGQQGQDILIGGTGGDEMYGDAEGSVMYPLSGADDGEDIMLGDNADIWLVAPNGAAGGDLKLGLGTAIYLLETTDTVDPDLSGGADVMSGNAGSDIIAGGVYGDEIHGDRADENATHSLDGYDIILGDNARLEWLSDGRFSEIGDIDISVENPDLWAKYGTAVADTDLTTLDLITTFNPAIVATSGARDFIYGDDKDDLIFGGTDADTLYGDDGDLEIEDATGGDDLMFGDHGRIYPQFSSLWTEGDWWDAFHSRNFFAIDTAESDLGDGDRMWGEEGDDSMLGQQGDDRMWGGGDDDDMTGGHNVSGGYDPIAAGAVHATLFAPIAVPAITSINDLMDGGSGDDAMAGDNAILWRRGDDLSPRFRALTADAIYDTDIDSITTNINAFGTRFLGESDPADAVGRDVTILDHDDDVQTTPNGRFGNDAMAGGADSDVMWGELGNDLMQGDGNIDPMAETDLAFLRHRVDVDDSGSNPDTDETLYFNIPEAMTDADDYMEGSGGSDLMYGGLGQDDIIGGSSALFGLDTEAKRPDTSDFIFGGVGIAIARNDIGATETEMLASEDGTTHLIETDADGHGRDADFIMGDNANVYRLVEGGASGTDPDDVLDEFLQFNYDDIYGIQILPRAMEQLDYQLGGADYNGGEYVNGAADPDGAGGDPADNGAADLIHGESGDDVIFGMTGSDVLFGEGQDDDIIGGYGHDWISGGTGQDGVLGDDGLILTSRNSADYGEPLYDIDALLDRDPRPKYADGNVLNETIKTPGEIQYAVINLEYQLKKTADLVPFSFDPDWMATDDEFPDNQDTTPYADDIIFGGLGTDWLHGGSGDDAISGAEALNSAYAPTFDMDGNPNGRIDLGYAQALMPANLNAMNPGDVLAFNPVDVDGQHTNNRLRAGEFALYDEYDPRHTILLNADGTLNKDDTGVQYLLNFDESEGILRTGGDVPKATGQQTSEYPDVWDDGKDSIFGDLGNDWLVGGTGRDNIYGGWGNDLLNADDDHDGHEDVNELNDFPDTHPFYEDRAYGGAGRDVLIGNTGGDRLIDWVGEYNSYLVPYAPFGQASVSRTLQPFLPDFLYALSAGDGADPTRVDDTGGDPLRNGEPDAEMGLVLQKDFAWQAQTGAPADPQAGNIPGGHRDVLRSATFNDENSQGFSADIGSWEVKSGRLYVAPDSLGGEAISVWHHDQTVPSYFELTASIATVKPIQGYKANSYVVFDYYSDDDFKFAGLNSSTNKVEIGQRTADGWEVLTFANMQIKDGRDYNILLALNGTTATVLVNNNVSLSYGFAPRVDVYGLLHNLNEGMVGLGADNAKASINNVSIQVLPPAITLTATDDFDGAPTLVSGDTGAWTSSPGHLLGGSGGGVENAIASGELTIGPAYVLKLETTVSTAATAGVVFDLYADDDFKWAAWSNDTDQVMIGHYTARDGWVVDESVSLKLHGDVELSVTLKGSTVSVMADGQVAASHVFNAVVTDGRFGLLVHDGTASFDSFTVSTDDPSFAEVADGGDALTAAAAGVGAAALDPAAADSIGEVAMARWTDLLGGEPAVFDNLEFVVGELQGLTLARFDENTITLDADAAGNGWFVDGTPGDSEEFRGRGVNGLKALGSSDAAGQVDLMTAMMHELGHALGFDHGLSMAGVGGLMDATLATGVRASDFAAPGPAAADPHDPLHPAPVRSFDADGGDFVAADPETTARLFSYVSTADDAAAPDRSEWLMRDMHPSWSSVDGSEHAVARIDEGLAEYSRSMLPAAGRSLIDWTDAF